MTSDQQLKRLDHLQAIINRMADNSFKLKGWCLTLVTALLGLALKNDGPGPSSPAVIAFLAILATVMFWVLDAYYLALEKGFRTLYNTPATAAEIAPPAVSLFSIACAAVRPATVTIYLVLVTMELLVGNGVLGTIIAWLH